jgi:hypothetical protein
VVLASTDVMKPLDIAMPPKTIRAIQIIDIIAVSISGPATC